MPLKPLPKKMLFEGGHCSIAQESSAQESSAQNSSAQSSSAQSSSAQNSSAQMPLVSVIIPAYNAEPFIARTLTSVLNQTYRRLEVIVVDDGSTDRTADIVRQFAAADSRLKLYQQRNLGVAAARNKAIAQSVGELIAPIDADDLWHASNVEKQVELFLQADESVGMVYAWTIDIDSGDRPTGNIRAALYHGNIYPALLYTNTIGHGSACIIRRCCLEAVGGYNSELRSQQAQGCEDWDLYLRIASRYQVGLVPELLVGYRVTESSMSAQSAAMRKSQQLTFLEIERRFPQVCEQIRLWTESAENRYACRRSLNARRPFQAWQLLYRAFLADPLVVLTTDESWAMLLLILVQSVPKRRAGLKRASRSPLDQPVADSFADASEAEVISRQGAKATLRQLVSPLFLSPLVRRRRMKWVSAQVCPDRPDPMGLPERPVNQLREQIRLRSKLANASVNMPVDFGQHLLRIHSAAEASSL